MIEANEINSTFYALRMLSHGLATSEIEVIDGEEYPASEFTKEEQEQALKIIHCIEASESISFGQLPPEKIHFYLASLAERMEELANSDLAKAGYTVDPLATSFQVEPLHSEIEPSVALQLKELQSVLAELTPRAVALQLEELQSVLAELTPQVGRFFELHYREGFREGLSLKEIAEMLDLSDEIISAAELARARARLRRA